jgi:predicted unusual protein kinase regulating ubiquinone biosynthesis (AarF/ABC1/UbiB family)
MLLDVGLVARLSGAHRGALAALLAAWATQDAGRICQIMLALAPGPPERDPAPLRAAVEDLLARYRTVALAEVQLGAVLLEITRLMRRHRVSLEPALTMIIVAIGVVEGVGRQLAPHLDLAREALAFFATLSPEQRAAFA